MNTLKLLFLTIFLVLNSFAQESSTSILQESTYELPDLIVTGTLWDTPISDISSSVTLFSDSALKDRQATHFEDLISTIPNLTSNGGANRAQYFQIRGLGENSQFEGETPDLSVRFLIDDFDFTGIGGIATLFDVGQVEVIRGAQSSAYGVHASAGIIKLSTTKASINSANKFKLSLGDANSTSFGYATGGTLGKESTAKTEYRLTYSQNKSDGFIENEFHGKNNTNQSKESFSLLKFSHKPTEVSNIHTSLVYADSNSSNDIWSLNNTQLKTQSDDIGEDNQCSKGISLRLNSNNIRNLSVTSITSLLNTDSLNSYDSDWGNYLIDENFALIGTSGFDGFMSVARDRKSFSQEIRADYLNDSANNSLFSKWTVGIFFHDLSESTDMDYLDNFDESDGRGDVFSDYETQNISLFSQGETQLSPNSKIILGLRYEYQTVDFSSETINNVVYSGTPSLDAGSTVSTSDNLIGGSLTYQNELSDNYRLSLSYNHGYKAAGANTSSFRTINGTSPLTFDTEKIDNYELGISYTNPSNTYRAKFNLFYLIRDNAQLRDSEGSGGFFNYFTSNAGRAKHYGAEYNSQWHFKPSWTVETNLSLLKAKLDNSNRDLSNAPSYKYALLLKYAPQNAFYSNVSITGSDDFYEENGHDYKRDAFTVVNAAIGYKKQQWDISLWAKNLFDQNYSKRIFYFENYHPDDAYVPNQRLYTASADPVHYGITVNYIW